ncbi:hypothetical protein CSA56_01385 [candidate division KSB3 bacterium]|uniref:Methyltransferase domain-containing protein n=1 Tax=candidate division KSB3 bacterium TaxID=2044937 RepID=A0A2G6KKB4_9BACT|nr:MAG: hypothetical protein CSA56_01385 [candidate division KSB3 bacterium]
MGIMYHYPQYYDIAFSFRNIPAETNTIETLIQAHSQIPVRHMLELACGNAPYIAEFNKRGYQYTGLDISGNMLDFTREKVRKLGLNNVNFLQGNMVDFLLPEPVDFACLLLGSMYIDSPADFVCHLDAVSAALKPGGLYLLEWCVEFEPVEDLEDSWQMEQDGIRIDVHYAAKQLNRLDQTYRETILLTVDDHGTPLELREEAVKLAVYPQEFLLRIAAHPCFEFVGWWNDWDLSAPLTGDEQGINRPIIVVRRS